MRFIKVHYVLSFFSLSLSLSLPVFLSLSLSPVSHIIFFILQLNCKIKCHLLTVIFFFVWLSIADVLPRMMMNSKNLQRNFPVLLKDLATIWMSKQRTQFPYRCERCGKGYQHRATLVRHTRHECGKEPQFGCPYCAHRTKQRGNLYQHIRTNHPGKNVFSSTI